MPKSEPNLQVILRTDLLADGPGVLSANFAEATGHATSARFGLLSVATPTEAAAGLANDAAVTPSVLSSVIMSFSIRSTRPLSGHQEDHDLLPWNVADAFFLRKNADAVPDTDSAYDLGAESFRFKKLYCVDGDFSGDVGAANLTLTQNFSCDGNAQVDGILYSLFCQSSGALFETADVVSLSGGQSTFDEIDAVSSFFETTSAQMSFVDSLRAAVAALGDATASSFQVESFVVTGSIFGEGVTAFFSGVSADFGWFDDTLYAASATFQTLSGGTGNDDCFKVVAGLFEMTSTTGKNVFRFKKTSTDTAFASVSSTSDGDIDFSTSGKFRMRLTNSGRLGIGTSSPEEEIDVVGDIKCNVLHGTAVQADYADIAEKYSMDKFYPVGSVVVVDRTGFSEAAISQRSLDPSVIGVISESPGFILNSQNGGVSIALVGKVPIRVVGRCKKGDRLVSSDVPGCARTMITPEEAPFSFALALQSSDDVSEKLVLSIVK